MNRANILVTTIMSTLVLGGGATLAAESRDKLMGLHRGGTLRLNAHASQGTIDPQIDYTIEYWPLFYVTNDQLVALKKAEGSEGNTLVPDLAEAVPEAQDNGTVYTFKLRDGIKFSTGKDVTTADVVASFQRIFKVSSPTAGTFYNNIIGADECLKSPATCTLKGGVEASEKDRTITLRLTHADAEFLYKLAMPHAAVLPAETPPKDLGTTPAAATGPYMIQSYDPSRGLKLVRNPFFKEFSVDAQPDGYADEIDYSFGLDDQAGITAVENDQADWTYDDPPGDRLGELGTKFAKQVHIHTVPAYLYAPMNVNIPPFNNPKARQAVAYAVDRKALVNLWGGANVAVPLCQFLPAGSPGHVHYCPFSSNPGPK